MVCRQVTAPQSAFVRNWRLPLGVGLVGWVAEHGISLIVPDVQNDERHYKAIDEQTGLNLRSILSVPLRIKQRTIGVIQVVDEMIDRFDQADQSLVEALAATAAIAVENAQLYQETDRLRQFNESIINSVEEGIFILDANKRMTFINPKGAGLLGYNPEELLGRHFLEMAPPNYADRVKAGFDQCEHGISSQYEITLLTKVNEPVSFIVCTRPLFDKDDFCGTLSAFMDVTWRKKTDQLLRKLCRAVEQSADQVFITDNRGVIEYVNPAFQKQTGFAGTDAIGQMARILKSGHHKQSFYQNLWKTILAGAVFRDVFINRKKSGELYYEEQTISPIKDEEGVITHFVATGRDITERKLTEETLQQAVEVLQRRNRVLDSLYHAGQELSSSLDLDKVLATVLEEGRHLLGAVACSIWLLDPKTSPDQPGNLVCRQAIGPHSDRVRGWRLKPGEGIAGTVAKTSRSLVVADLMEDDRHFKGVDQAIGLNLRSVISVPLKRINRGVIGVLQVLDTAVGRFKSTDIVLVESLAATAAIAVENAQLYQQAQRDAKTKTVLLDEINHRVKNNLSAIIGILYTEQGRPELKENSRYREIINNVIHRVQGLATAHNLLSASMWGPIFLRQLIEQIIYSTLQALPSNRGVDVQITQSEIRVTPSQAHYLALIINELTMNTIKHGLPYGSDTAQITVGINPREHQRASSQTVVLEFQDNGPGYPEELLQSDQGSFNVGLDLIQNIVTKSLRGNMSLRNQNGAVTQISFSTNREVS